MKERKAFNFYKSYYDVAVELPAADRDDFVWAIIDSQFTGTIVEPKSKLARLMFLGQKHSVLKQLEGFLAATKPPTEAPPEGGSMGATEAPQQQEQEKEQEQVKEKEQVKLEFESFWNLYGKKMDRVKCESKWMKLKPADKAKIFETLPDYIKSTPDLKYRKNPATYLNNKSWENEIAVTEVKKSIFVQ